MPISSEPRYHSQTSRDSVRRKRPVFDEQRVHVAAICYRANGAHIEFLLVRTSSGRWTFPKGGVDDGLTRTRAVAREALEEAGATCRVEPRPFASYMHSKRLLRAPFQRHEYTVEAYLCSVKKLAAPEEPYRDPTWFPAGEAKRRLRQGRAAKYARELCTVVDRAIMLVHADA